MSLIVEQLKIWDYLVEERMRFEEILQKCNSLPQFNVKNDFINEENNKLLKNQKNAQDSLINLFKEFVEFEKFISKSNNKILHNEKFLTNEKNESDLNINNPNLDNFNLNSNDSSEIDKNEDYLEYVEDEEFDEIENFNEKDENEDYLEYVEDEEFDEIENLNEKNENEVVEDHQLMKDLEKYENLNEINFELNENLDSFNLKIENYLKSNYNNINKSRDDILNFWFEKTKCTLKGGKLDKSSMNDFEQSIVKSINHALLNRLKLIKRTQLKRGNYTILGKPVEKEMLASSELLEKKKQEYYDSEIFDDSDFYHQLLRELVNSLGPSNMNNSSKVNPKWIKLIRERYKLKKPVDTKATKSRRIRYKVHEKLVNFMTPLKQLSSFDDQQIDNLINSLFGKKITRDNLEQILNNIEDSDSE